MKLLKEIVSDISEGKNPCYVYLLHKPNGLFFYVGKATVREPDAYDQRISWHEYEARSVNQCTNRLKINTIRKIWRNSGQVLYSIDSWHDTAKAAYEREIELIASIGRQIMGTGPLTNITEGGEGDRQPEEVRQKISSTLKKYFSEHPEARESCSDVARKVWNENPQVRSAFIENHTKDRGDCVAQWMKDHPGESEKARAKQSESLKSWYNENEQAAKELAIRRNEILRSDEHRNHMSNATRNWIEKNPEADQRRRQKHREMQSKKTEIRQECLKIINDRLVSEGKVKQSKKLSHSTIYRWKKRGVIPSDFFPDAWSSIEEWGKFRNSL